MSTLTAKEPPEELGLKGKGVEAVQIPEIDTLVRRYISAKDAFSRAGSTLSEEKGKLVDAMHEHSDELRDPDGALIYNCHGTVVSLIQGAEKLKVEEA